MLVLADVAGTVDDNIIGFFGDICVVQKGWEKTAHRFLSRDLMIVYGREAAEKILTEGGHSRGTAFKDIAWYAKEKDRCVSGERLSHYITPAETLKDTHKVCLGRFIKDVLTLRVYNTAVELIEAEDDHAVSKDGWVSTLWGVQKV